jgi:hypothetical protein
MPSSQQPCTSVARCSSGSQRDNSPSAAVVNAVLHFFPQLCLTRWQVQRSMAESFYYGSVLVSAQQGGEATPGWLRCRH